MAKLDWVALPVALLAYFFDLGLASRWTERAARMKYEGWRMGVRTWFAWPGWAWQPLLFVLQGLAASAIFLFWRNEFASTPTANFDAVMGLTIANVFFLHLWTPLFLWGPRWFWAATLDAFFVFATGVAVLALIGVEKAWLPFGLYITYPVVMFFVMIFSLVFWWAAARAEQGWQALRKGLTIDIGPEGLSVTRTTTGKLRTRPRQPRAPASAWGY